MSLHKSAVGDQKTSLAFMFTWLMARENQIDKYRRLYLDRGIDVLTNALTPVDVLRPRVRVRTNAQRIYDYFLSSCDSYQKVVVHAFSGGVYHYSEVVSIMYRNPAIFSQMKGRFKGAIYDSPADTDGIPSGVAQAYFLKRPIIRCAAQYFIKTYLNTIGRDVCPTMEEVRDTIFVPNPLNTPILLFYSPNDAILPPNSAKRYVDSWKASGVHFVAKKWEDTEHCKHYVKYPQEYEQILSQFLNTIGFNTKLIGNNLI